MGWITLLAIYFIIWWITLFMVLPFGITRQTDGIVGQDTGAPQSPKIIFKMCINTILAFCIWLIVFICDYFDIIVPINIGVSICLSRRKQWCWVVHFVLWGCATTSCNF